MGARRSIEWVCDTYRVGALVPEARATPPGYARHRRDVRDTTGCTSLCRGTRDATGVGAALPEVRATPLDCLQHYRWCIVPPGSAPLRRDARNGDRVRVPRHLTYSFNAVH